ncbi:HypC/HybG/HupF family hydrogenase formation chaperone [Yinghuangia seranimata]|uniref:HypC/HybG/HupF family hydrogenase formation chaperone n=1 Tax=Yinghuangia seranimata TaxID=408067 RepID=UPI00248AF56A|nr:HypC/HybG/HupF family hydrogenase formation chaperone [Yinghuangia seranimata]MDI2130501.1 HypC/HybG/HupF family hydrogenase formation chaperone [Yinghuangia seranimata]
MCLGVPGRIERILADPGLRTGVVDFGGVRREVCLAYTPDAEVGHYVVVHVGFAISLVDETEAMRTLALLREVDGLMEAELGPERAPAPGGERP